MMAEVAAKAKSWPFRKRARQIIAQDQAGQSVSMADARNVCSDSTQWKSSHPRATPHACDCSSKGEIDRRHVACGICKSSNRRYSPGGLRRRFRYCTVPYRSAALRGSGLFFACGYYEHDLCSQNKCECQLAYGGRRTPRRPVRHTPASSPNYGTSNPSTLPCEGRTHS